MAGRTEVLGLYRAMMRYAGKFGSYNFRNHALRRVKYGFVSNKNILDQEEIAKQFLHGKTQLELVKRQAMISQLYPESGGSAVTRMKF